MSKIRHTPADEPFFLIRSAAGAMPHGATIAPHAHDWHQLIVARSGVLSVRTDRGALAIPPGWAVWAGARTAHAIAFHGACEYVALYIRRRAHRSLPAASSAIALSDLMTALVARVASVGMLDRRNAAHRAMAQLIYAELSERAAPTLALSLPYTEPLRALAEHVLADAGSAADIAGLARRFGLSRRTLERQFAGETGLSFGRWRRHARFLAAITALGQGASVAAAARRAGYRSPSAFIAAFADVFAATPGRMFGRD